MKEYRFIKSADYKTNPNNIYTFGIIQSINDQEVILPILYDANLLDHTNYHICFTNELYVDADGEQLEVIVLSDRFRKIAISEPSIFEAIIMHELGHYFHDYEIMEKYNFDNKDLSYIRANYIAHNDILPNEAMADQFAASQVGKRSLIKAIELLKKQRIQRPNDPGKFLALKEFDLRIMKLK